MTYSERLRALRERTGLSQRAFGMILVGEGAITQTATYNRYELGIFEPEREREAQIIRALAERLNVSYNDVLLELRGEA